MSRKDILSDSEETGFNTSQQGDENPIQDHNQEDLYKESLKPIDQNQCMDEDILKQIQLQHNKEQDLQHHDTFRGAYMINNLKYRRLIQIKSLLNDPHSGLGKYLKKAIKFQYIQIYECDDREKIEKLIMHNNRDDKMFQYLTQIQNKKKRKMLQFNMLKYQITKSNIKCLRKNNFIEKQILYNLNWREENWINLA